MLLTGVRKGDHEDLKHCICIDIDNPKDEEIDGREFVKMHKKLFKGSYVETTGSGGTHYIYLLDVDSSNSPLIGHTKHKYEDETYSIDILANSQKCIIAPCSYSAGNKVLSYETSMDFINDIDYISPRLLKLCR
jgi:hypothetical protein